MMGVPLPNHHTLDHATLIPTVGCPMGCNFCSTSAMFGGKGKFIEFYKTGDELFEIMWRWRRTCTSKVSSSWTRTSFSTSDGHCGCWS